MHISKFDITPEVILETLNLLKDSDILNLLVVDKPIIIHLINLTVRYRERMLELNTLIRNKFKETPNINFDELDEVKELTKLSEKHDKILLLIGELLFGLES